jgi:putative transposase
MGAGDFSEAAHVITGYVVVYYSSLRPHEYNGSSSPNKSENRYWKNSNAVASISCPLQYSNANYTEIVTIRPSQQCRYTITFEEE